MYGGLRFNPRPPYVLYSQTENEKFEHKEMVKV